MWVYTRNNVPIKRELVNLAICERIYLAHEGDMWRVAAHYPENVRVYLTEILPDGEALSIIERINKAMGTSEHIDLNPVS